MYLILQSGRTPLHEAASQEYNSQGVEILVKAGADGNVVDKVSCFHHHSLQTDSFQEQTILKIFLAIQ